MGRTPTRGPRGQDTGNAGVTNSDGKAVVDMFDTYDSMMLGEVRCEEDNAHQHATFSMNQSGDKQTLLIESRYVVPGIGECTNCTRALADSLITVPESTSPTESDKVHVKDEVGDNGRIKIQGDANGIVALKSRTSPKCRIQYEAPSRGNQKLQRLSEFSIINDSQMPGHERVIAVFSSATELTAIDFYTVCKLLRERVVYSRRYWPRNGFRPSL